ncbi:MAG: hypothetical protein QHJ82_03920 [Verrucomicrobiota bacterium]|nr:hypothetical protein [Verrucomicrobiota bacterium]
MKQRTVIELTQAGPRGAVCAYAQYRGQVLEFGCKPEFVGGRELFQVRQRIANAVLLRSFGLGKSRHKSVNHESPPWN